MMKKNFCVCSVFLAFILFVLLPVDVKAYAVNDDIVIRPNTEYTVTINEEDFIFVDFNLKVDNTVYIRIYDVVTRYVVYPGWGFENGTEYTDKSRNYLEIEVGEDIFDDNDNIYYLRNGSDSITIEYDADSGENELIIDNHQNIAIGPNGSSVSILSTTFKIRVDTQSPDKKMPAEEISLPKKATVTKGFTKKLKARVVDDSSTLTGLKWRSSNKKIATVDSSGNVKGKKNGNCKITCTLKNGKKYVCKLKVAPNVYHGYSYSKCNVKRYPYGSVTLLENKVYYKGGNLVVTCIAANNRVFSAIKFSQITLTVEASGNKVIAKKKFSNVGLNISPFGKKLITFTFPKSSIRRKNFDLRDDYLQLRYRYSYQYSYT